MDRLIFHIDVNSAFLSWEAARRVAAGEEDLRLIPSAIGGDRDKRTGIILAKSIPAKERGIKTGEPVTMALRKCPELVLAKPDFRLYERSSRAFMDICRRYAPVVEKFSIDECFLDMTGTRTLYPDPVGIAAKIKNEIRDTLGFTVNVGIAANKLLAKMASDFKKPDRIHTLFADEIPQKMWPLPVGDLFSVGKATSEKLDRAGIRTIGDLAQTGLQQIQRLAGVKMGAQLYRFANGIDDSPVRSEREAAKGYGNSVTLEEDVTTLSAADQVLLELCDSTASRMRADHAYCGGVSVTIRFLDFKTRSHQRKLAEPTDVTLEIIDTARQLIRELWDGHTPLRLLGVTLTDIDREGAAQLSLFPNEEKARHQKVDQTVDALRGRFGADAIVRGSCLHSNLRVGKKYKAQIELANQEGDLTGDAN